MGTSDEEPPLKMVLPSAAYTELPEGEPYVPVVPAEHVQAELSVRSVVVGLVVGVVFGAANAYLGLKVGLTVSASIPAAVIAVATFRAMRGGTLLETNIAQTVGSNGESLAAGVIFTLPVLYLWGESPGFWPIFPLSLFGGLLGVLFMIPLRRFLIVQEHGRLTYPEGTACAEVQVAAQAGGSQARILFMGMLVGALYTAIEKLGRLWPSEPDVTIDRFGYRTSVGADVTPELLGVGFIIGPRVAAVMVGGGAVGWLVILPLIALFGASATEPIPPETTALVRDMDSFALWSRYLRYVGAGAVAFGGLFSLLKSTPVLLKSFRLAMAALREGTGKAAIRTERELSIATVGAGLLAIALGVAFLPLMTGSSTALGVGAGLAVVVFSFFFVTVSSRIVGLIGSSSNPVSGMTIATVLICALLFGQAYEPGQAKVAVLTIGALVCMAAAMAGDTSQDLKTGFLLGATPRNQQISELIGVVVAALAMSTVLSLFEADIVSGAFKAPQANLIKLVIDGVLDQNLPWGLVGAGAAMAAVIELMGLPTLAFAVGLYLPIHLAVPVGIGGAIRFALEQWARDPEQVESRREAGVLYGSGLVAGAALVGVAVATLAFLELELPGQEPAPTVWLPAVLAFGALCASLVWASVRER